MEREWILGKDVSMNDSLLDGFTFEQVITALQCNYEEITPEDVARQVDEMLKEQQHDMDFLLQKNMDRIIAAAMEGRE